MTKSGPQMLRKHPDSVNVHLLPYISKKMLAISILAIASFGFILFLLTQSIKSAPVVPLKISSKGLSELEFEQLNKLMKKQKKVNYFSANLTDIRDSAQKLSWVKEVSVTRDWHKGIMINVLPRQPVARFGSERLVDANGDVFEPANASALTEYRLATLQGNPEQLDVIMAQMQHINAWYAPLGITVEDIILTPRMTWLIRFDSGLRLLVDGENTAQKLMNVSQVLQNQLKNKHKKIQAIDMRYKNGFAISWKGGKKPV